MRSSLPGWDGKPDQSLERTEICGTCRESVPVNRITAFMGRRVCLACAAMMQGDEEDEDE
jgi:heterodisulfide reductase subunit C